jgi:hypothetical protein
MRFHPSSFIGWQRRAGDRGAAEDGGGGGVPEWGVTRDRGAAGDGGCGAVLLIHVVAIARASVSISVREPIGLGI